LKQYVVIYYKQRISKIDQIWVGVFAHNPITLDGFRNFIQFIEKEKAFFSISVAGPGLKVTSSFSLVARLSHPQSQWEHLLFIYTG
jgi:hypothetical protein